LDVLPWRFPIVRLTWGRAVAGAHAAVWSVAETVDGRIVTGAWKDGANAALDPHGLPPGVTVGESRVFLDADVASLEGLHLGPLRNLLALSSGDPHETKRRTSCVIAGEAGVGVDETVTWRTRRR